MTSNEGRTRLAKELLVVGFAILAVAYGLTEWSCSHAASTRVTNQAFNRLVCPDAPAGPFEAVPTGYFLFSRLFLLWLLGAGTVAAGAVMGVRTRLERRRASAVAATAYDSFRSTAPDPAAAAPKPSFGRKPAVPAPRAPSREAFADLDRLSARVREAVSGGELDEALGVAEAAVASSGLPELVDAADDARPVTVDWVEVTAAAIEADVWLKEAGAAGVGEVILAIGSLDENRTRVRQEYFAPGSGARGFTRDRPSRPLQLDALEPLAAIERRAVWSADAEEWERNVRASRLAGLLLVLRYLDAVRRAATAGLPFAVRLQAKVESIGGEAAISQRDPMLAIDLPCPRTPIGEAVVERLAQRRQRQLEQWRADSETSLTNFRREFLRTGYVHSRFIPRSASDYERFNELERRLAIHEPENRVSPQEFERVYARVAEAMAREFPPPIDPAPYLS